MNLSTYNNEAAEVAIRNANRDAGKYAVTATATPNVLSVARIGAEGGERDYTVLVDEAGVPFFCTCPQATEVLICKHQYLAAETLALWNAESDFENAEDLYAKL
jgi:hypothetical protein